MVDVTVHGPALDSCFSREPFFPGTAPAITIDDRFGRALRIVKSLREAGVLKLESVDEAIIALEAIAKLL